LAGEKEPRMALALVDGKGLNTVLETTVGGRFGLVRHGTAGSISPQGSQLDMEAAVQTRLSSDGNTIIAADYRFGMVRTHRSGPTAIKYGYYHVSSHLGDEFLIKNPFFDRINYTRDSAIWGISHDKTRDVRIYGEVAYAIMRGDFAEPWEVQFGVQYSPARPRGAPYVAMNAHLREDFDFGGVFNCVFGWQWRADVSDRLFRFGGQFFDGPSMQYSFFDRHERFVGIGFWYDR